MVMLLLTALFSTLLSGLFSGMETGLYSLQKARLRVRAGAGDQRAKRLLGFAERPGSTVATILILNNIVNYVVSWSTGELFDRFGDPESSDVERGMLATLTLTPILFIFGELLPKTAFLKRPAAMVLFAQPIFTPCAALVWPLTAPILLLLKALRDDSNEGALLARPGAAGLLLEGEGAAALSPAQRDLAAGVVELRRLRARELTVPWEHVAKLSHRASQQEALRVSRETGHKRLVLVDAQNKPLGRYVNVLEFALSEPPLRTADECSHEMPIIEPKMPLLEVLGRLQDERRALALVRETDGRPLGILTTAEISEGFFGVAKADGR